MRALAIFLYLVAGCESEPSIACSVDDQCLSGQTCADGFCRAPSTLSMPDAAGGSRDDDAMLDGSTMPDAPPPTTCTPACSGGTPYCDNGQCVQCTAGTQCPLTAPICSNHVCTL